MKSTLEIVLWSGMLNQSSKLNSFKKGLLVISTFFAFSLTIINSSRIFSLWDFSNYSDIAMRILEGQVPYLDFPLYTQPGTFFELATFLWLFGNNIISIYLIIFIKILIYNLIWLKILDKIGIDLKIYGLVFLIISFTSPWFIVPQPTYDADLAFAIIASFYLLYNLDYFKFKVQSIITFVTVLSPFWYKQTSGMAWIALVTIYLILQKKYSLIFLSYFYLFIVVIFSSVLFSQEIISKWFINVIIRPFSIRLNDGRNLNTLLNDILNITSFLLPVIFFFAALFLLSLRFKNLNFYRYLILYSPIILISRFLIYFNFDYYRINWQFILESIVIWNFIIILVNFVIFGWKVKFIFYQLLLFVTCFANSLSQGISGSSYAFWSIYLLIYLINFKLLQIKNWNNLEKTYRLSAIFIFSSFILYLPILFYGFSLERMNFLRFDENVHTYSKLYLWIGTPGHYLKESETGISLFEKYKLKGNTAVWPGEDPVSFFSKKIPDTNVSVSDITTNPEYDSVEKWLDESDIKYVILKTRLQLPGLHQVSVDKFSIAKNNYIEIEKRGVYVVLERK